MKIQASLRLCRICDLPKPMNEFSPRGSICRSCAIVRARERTQLEKTGDTRLSFEDFFGGSKAAQKAFEQAGFEVLAILEDERRLWVLPSTKDEVEGEYPVERSEE